MRISTFNEAKGFFDHPTATRSYQESLTINLLQRGKSAGTPKTITLAIRVIFSILFPHMKRALSSDVILHNYKQTTQ